MSDKPRVATVSDSVGDRSPATDVYVGGKPPAADVLFKPRAAGERVVEPRAARVGKPRAAMHSTCVVSDDTVGKSCVSRNTDPIASLGG